MGGHAWQCTYCKYVYVESDGEETENIIPGTKWDDLGDDFRCPFCRAKKKAFSEISE